MQLSAQGANLVKEKIAKSLGAVAHLLQRGFVHEIGEQDGVARVHIRANGVDGMIGVLTDGKGVAGIGGEGHLQDSLISLIGASPVKDGTDMLNGAIWGEVKLNGHSLPARVRVDADSIARNVSGQNGDGIHANATILRAKTFLKAWGQAMPECLP